ncbi:phasin family protein [Hyphobacterium sp.]|uniref:phasin family protein n=1 Tax=Hyphobacterium sp. TaxID=2004662 RepID=UPI003BA9C86C
MTKATAKPAADKAKTAKKPASVKAAATAPAKAESAPKTKTPAKKAAVKKSVARKPVKAKSSPKKDTKTMTKAQTTVVNETIEKMTSAGNEAFKEGFEKSLKSVNDVNAFTKENVDAVIASATAAGKNAETLNANAVAYAKTSMESAVAATKALTGAKSVQDMIEVQTDFVKSSMDLFLAEMNKTTDLYAGAVKDVTKPINDRFAASVEMVQSAR